MRFASRTYIGASAAQIKQIGRKTALDFEQAETPCYPIDISLDIFQGRKLRNIEQLHA